MSLSIDVDEVMRVLLADGWHEVANSSFAIDAYEYLWKGQLVHGGDDGGFSFDDKLTGMRVYGPMSALLAVAGYA